MNTSTFNFKEAQNYCMSIGWRIGLYWAISFLCTMYGIRLFLRDIRLGLLIYIGLFLGLYSIYAAGKYLRLYCQGTNQVTFSKLWWMAMLTFFCATLLTTLVQGVYFRYLDGGALAEQLKNIISMPQFNQMYKGINMKEQIEIFEHPTQVILNLFSENTFLSLIFSIPSALIGLTGKKKN